MLTASALIEQGLTTPTSVYDVPATSRLTARLSRMRLSTGRQAYFLGIIHDSMNTGTVLVGQKLSKEERYNWLKKFYGVGEFTGIELTGEEQGIIADWRDWDGRQQYTVLFGQGVAQTPAADRHDFPGLGKGAFV